MKSPDTGRRIFLLKSAAVAGTAMAPVNFVFSQTVPLRVRPEWQVFKNTSQYDALVSAVRTMKAVTNENDARSWSYWTNIHVNRCPHGIAYFLGWHRGYLYHFERQLRTVSGIPDLVLPYWDYYTYPTLPSEFTNPTAGNPLYVPRVNTNVSRALTMAPFSRALVNFPRGASNAFEPSIENAPHNPVHNIIGGIMSTMQSPVDPIFWLHHANIDRLWVAWAGAGGGRQMPLRTATYWNGNYTYNAALSMQRRWTYDTRTNLGYSYRNESMPTALPAAVSAQPMLGVSANADAALPAPPATGTFRLSNPRLTGHNTFSAGGSLDVELDERSVSAQLPVRGEYGRSIAQIARGVAWTVPGSTTKFKSVQLVLDGLQLTTRGRTGGYYFQIYLNFPSAGAAPSRVTSALIGSLGPFEIAGAAHHPGGPARLRYVITHLVSGLSAVQLGMLTISFVRIDGENAPRGPVVRIGEARIELSTDDARS